MFTNLAILRAPHCIYKHIKHNPKPCIYHVRLATPLHCEPESTRTFGPGNLKSCRPGPYFIGKTCYYGSQWAWFFQILYHIYIYILYHISCKCIYIYILYHIISRKYIYIYIYILWLCHIYLYISICVCNIYIYIHVCNIYIYICM